MLTPASLLGQEDGGAIDVPGITQAEISVGDPIAIVGPSKMSVGVESTYRLTGTPKVDISKPLDQQLDWALGEDRMYCYLARPGQALEPLDVRLELVIAAQGMTFQPLLRVMPISSGNHRILVDWNLGQDMLAEVLVPVEGINPNPSPGPGPSPNPNPGPEPEPEPTTGDLFVLITQSTEDVRSLPVQQQEIFHSALMGLYLNQHCAKRDGQPEWRVLDNEADVQYMPEDWQDTFDRAKDKEQPWVIIANNRGESFEGPLPASVPDMMTLLKKYGGD
jgi:hypothetical protein